jgi:hypothetical protein
MTLKLDVCLDELFNAGIIAPGRNWKGTFGKGGSRSGEEAASFNPRRHGCYVLVTVSDDESQLPLKGANNGHRFDEKNRWRSYTALYCTDGRTGARSDDLPVGSAFNDFQP